MAFHLWCFQSVIALQFVNANLWSSFACSELVKIVAVLLELRSDTARNFNLFSYLENCRTWRKSILDIKCVLQVPVQLLFETYFAPMNIYRVMLEMPVETHYIFFWKIRHYPILIALKMCCQILDNSVISDFLTVRWWVLDMSRADRHVAELIPPFCNFSLRTHQPVYCGNSFSSCWHLSKSSVFCYYSRGKLCHSL